MSAMEKIDPMCEFLSDAGVPVATVGIGNSRNAGLLAVRILATSEPALLERIDLARASVAERVREKDSATRERFAN